MPSPVKLRGPLERTGDHVLRRPDQRPTMIESERGRSFRAEIVRGHRSGKRDHVRRREGRQLERREIAVTEPALVRRRDHAEVQPFEQARPTVAATNGNRQVDAWVACHPHHGRQPFVVRRGKSLPPGRDGGIDDDAMSLRFQAGDRARDCCRIGREARGCVEADAVRAAGHAWLVSAASKKKSTASRRIPLPAHHRRPSHGDSTAARRTSRPRYRTLPSLDPSHRKTRA